MIKNIGIVADADSIYIKKYVEFVLLKLKNYKFIIFSETNSKFTSFYKRNNIEVIDYSLRKCEYNKKTYFDKVIDSINLLAFSFKKHKIDKVIFQYVHIYIFLLMKFINVKFDYIPVYWGSDVFRCNEKLLNLVKKQVLNSKYIVTDSEDMIFRLKELYGENIEDNIKIIRFGNNTIDIIKNKEKNKTQIKHELLNENAEKKTITIGYNAIEQQQHLKIIESLNNLSKKEKEKICILLPLTYPKNDDYISKIKYVIDKTDISYMIFEKYLNDEEIADLCLTTDIFIHGQTTDSMSSSMIEHIYAGNVVFNGSWIHYEMFDKYDINLYNFKEFEELKEIIFKYDDTKYNICKARESIEKEYSIDAYCEKWKDVLDKYF